MSSEYERQQWISHAEAAVEAYIEQGSEGEDDETVLSDLLADLMHWSQVKGLSFAQCLQRAHMHAVAESPTVHG